jgi:DNA-binding protein HU-beta
VKSLMATGFVRVSSQFFERMTYMASVTKQDLIKRVVARVGNKTNRDVTEIVNGMLEEVRDALKSGDDVRLINFGVFSVRKSAARDGVNPKTGARMKVPEKMRVKFAPGKELNEAVASIPIPKSPKK